MRMGGRGLPELQLIKESRFGSLWGERRSHEASGVHMRDGHLHVVFDDTPSILRLGLDWDGAAEAPSVIDIPGRTLGYEGITFDEDARRWYCLVEASERPGGDTMPAIDELDESFGFLGSTWLDFPIKQENKGIEGVSTLRFRNEVHLLGLCEGNGCLGGSAGRQPGKGRIQVFRLPGGARDGLDTPERVPMSQ